jgi:predicted secreted protein
MIEIGFVFGFAIYGIVWFLTLFMVLPFGVVSQSEAGEVVPGSEGGAPSQPRIGRKLLITTLISGVLYSGIYYLLTSGALANADIPFLPDFRGQR